MSIASAVSDLDVKSWIRGLVGAAISGGSNAVSGSSIVSMLAPETFNLKVPGKFFELALSLFVASAFISIMKYLSMHSLPDEKIVVNTVEVTSQPGTKPTTVTTTEETHSESKST